MRRICILCALALLPVLAFAKGGTTIYSLNGYFLYAGDDDKGAGLDFCGTHYFLKDTVITPAFTLGMGLFGRDAGVQGDIKALAGVGFLLNDFLYFDVQAGARAFLQLGSPTTAGVDLLLDANMLLHVGEIIGLRVGCAFYVGNDDPTIAPHIGIATALGDLFSLLFT